MFIGLKSERERQGINFMHVTAQLTYPRYYCIFEGDNERLSPKEKPESDVHHIGSPIEVAVLNPDIDTASAGASLSKSNTSFAPVFSIERGTYKVR